MAATRHDYGASSDFLNSPSHSEWAAAVAADITTAVSAAVAAGTVISFAGSTPPPGWHLCDGTAHGSSTLETVSGSPNAPDLRGKFIIGSSSAHPLRSSGGADTATIGASEMASHTHSDSGHKCDLSVNVQHSDGPTVSGESLSSGIQAGGRRRYHDTTELTHANVGNTGGSASHNNMPPFYVLTYVIKK